MKNQWSNLLLLLLLPGLQFYIILATETQSMDSKASPESDSKNSSTKDRSEPLQLRVAILIENSVQVDHNSILQGVSDVNRTTISTLGVTIETAIDISYGVDPYKALLRACSLLQTNSDIIISKTSCETANTLKYMAQTLKVNHVLLPHTSSCAREDDSIDFFQKPDGEEESLHNSFNIPSQTSLEPVFQMISKIVNKFTWQKVVLFHDSTYTQQVKLMSSYLKNTVRRDEDFNVFRYNVYEKNQGKNQVLNYLQELQAATDHEFRKKKSSNQLRAQLLDLIEDDENYRVTFTNFVVVANTQNSLEILAEGKRGGFVGQSCKWILANPDVDPRSLTKISNDTNVIAILRSLPQQSSRDSFKGEPEETTEEEGESDEMGESIQSQWLIPERLPNTFQTDLVVSFIQDAITIAATATASTAHSNKTKSNVPVTCFEEKTTKTTTTANKSNTSTSNSSNSSGTILRGSPLLQNMEYNQFHNPLTGIVTYDSHLGILSSSDLIAARYSLIPSAATQNSDSRRTQPFIINTDSEDARHEDGKEEEEEVIKWEVIAEYSVQNRSWVEKNRSLFRDEFNSLKGLTLRIVTIEEEPFIIKKKTSAGLSYTGYCIDILTAIQRHVTEHGAPFDYRLYEVADKSYGVFDTSNNKWTGLVGDIVSGKADMAVAGMIRNYERESVVDFAASFMDYGVGILIRKPQKTTSEFGFLEPFTVQVWICISVATFAIGTTLFVMSRLSPYSEWNRDGGFDFNFHNSMWFALASLMQQGCDVTPRTISGRIIGTFWWFFTLIIIATYTANLAAFLTVTRMDSPIESLQDLANQQKISYGTVSSSSLEQFFMKQADVDPSYKKIWNYMDSSRPLSMVQGVDEGYKRVLRGDYAFMWDYPVLMYQKKKHCELATVGKPFNRKNYAFALPKNAAYLESITLSILALQETGELEKLRQKWFEAESLCSDEDGSSGDDSTNTAQGLEMQNVAGVFYILVMGAALSILTSLLEVIWYRFLQIPKFESNHSVLPPTKV